MLSRVLFGQHYTEIVLLAILTNICELTKGSKSNGYQVTPAGRFVDAEVFDVLVVVAGGHQPKDGNHVGDDALGTKR